ncbi:hypothetical protein T4C_9658 [Trichinella pseudospiralis]|uniref:Uncharacterized protein n=1 Tax=Trichinella pseudospiralis TaxID=6337 RepID=A0A0V1INB3_TRIPS|nr:hypothetical protein T4C_9658 [Trichinella pseudospiralis]
MMTCFGQFLKIVYVDYPRLRNAFHCKLRKPNA